MLATENLIEESKSSNEGSFKENKASANKKPNPPVNPLQFPEEFDYHTQVSYGMNSAHSKYFKMHIGMDYKTQFFRLRHRFLRLINKPEIDQRIRAITELKKTKIPFLILIKTTKRSSYLIWICGTATFD